MSFPRYPKYKDSGVEWLGEVPAHWEVISIKWLSPVKRGASPRPIDDPKYFDDEGQFAWVRIADVSACDGVLNETTQRLSELGSSLSVKIAPGELFVSIAGTVGKPCISAIKACIHDGFVYFPTLEIDPLFLYRVFEGGVCYGGLGKWGTQLNLNTDTIGSIRVALPPADELKNILAFLDRETGKIDELVAEQRRLMALLKEKRQAVISHAVTRGLNPAAPLQPSGIEWLGDVPAHWEVKPLGRITLSRCDGPFGSGLKSEHYAESGVRVIRLQNIRAEGFNDSDAAFIDKEYHDDELTGHEVVAGDVLIAGLGDDNNLVGRACVAPGGIEPAMVKADCFRFRLDRERALPNFVATVLSVSATFDAGVLATGTTRSRIPLSITCGRRIPLPPLAEQTTIVAHLERELATFDALTTEAQRAIALLQERRTALISAAVTGQIDVRAAGR